MVRPVAKRFRVSNPFGRRGNYAAGYHTGIDYAAPVGTPVRSVVRGTVVSAGWEGSYGLRVVVRGRLGRRTYLYAHLTRTKAKPGQKVKRGQVIGFVGNTGNSTGPHLHHEQRTRPFGYWNHKRPRFV